MYKLFAYTVFIWNFIILKRTYRNFSNDFHGNRTNNVKLKFVQTNFRASFIHRRAK